VLGEACFVGAAAFVVATGAVDCGSASAMVPDNRSTAVLNVFAIFKVVLRF
jgi:hypothetical protein